MNRKCRVPAIGLVLIITLGGCRLTEVWQQTRAADEAGQIQGQVVLAGGQSGPVEVVLFEQVSANRVVQRQQVQIDEDGNFRFHVLPGRYYVGAFVDVNRDEAHQASEEAVMFGKPSALIIERHMQKRLRLTIRGLLPENPAVSAQVMRESNRSLQNIGRIVSLQDPVFDPRNGSRGLWQPLDYLKNIGAGLFLLEAHDPARIPVLFIHGANGSPSDWLPVLRQLDRQRFAPWILGYPSGLRLDVVSDYVELAVAKLVERYQPGRLFVVAHSMGGLVARSFIFKWRKRHPSLSSRIRFLMTINTPLGGMPEAGSGVAYSPLVVPSWRDVATGSAFLQKLDATPWPASLPWTLIFSYQQGKGSDGVVALESQLPLARQSEASRIIGFRATHAGILSDTAFLAYLKQHLDRMAGADPVSGLPAPASRHQVAGDSGWNVGPVR